MSSLRKKYSSTRLINVGFMTREVPPQGTHIKYVLGILGSGAQAGPGGDLKADGARAMGLKADGHQGPKALGFPGGPELSGFHEFKVLGAPIDFLCIFIGFHKFL